MWVITLCGITPMLALHGEEPNDDMRIVVDPAKKRWIVAQDAPYCLPVKDSKEPDTEGQ